MSSITADGLAAPAASPVGGEVGPLEQKHLQNANYRAVAGGDELTKTHWHIASANALGWGFDGMDGVIFGLISPLVIKEFSLTIPEYRSGVQIALFFGIAGLYFWPWLSDRLGRRTLLAVNIALFSLLMPVVAMSPTFATFVDRALGGRLRAQRRMVARIDAGGGDLAGAAARPGDQRHALDLVPRRVAGGRHHRIGGRRLRLARCGDGARRDRPARRSTFAPPVRNRRIGCARRIASSASPKPCRAAAASATRTAPGSARRSRSASARCSCRTCCRHAGGAVRGLLQHLHLRHRRRLDAALSRHRKALVDRRIQPVLRVLGPLGIPRPLRRRLARRQDRPAAGVRRDADRGRDLHDAVGLHRQPRAAVGVRSGLELSASSASGDRARR